MATSALAAPMVDIPMGNTGKNEVVDAAIALATMKTIQQDDRSQVGEIAIGDVGHQMVMMP